MKIDDMEKYAVFPRVNKFADTMQTWTGKKVVHAIMRLRSEKKGAPAHGREEESTKITNMRHLSQ